MIKTYKCKYCGFSGDRKTVRSCIMTHVKTDKSYRDSKRRNSNITESMIRGEFKE